MLGLKRILAAFALTAAIAAIPQLAAAEEKSIVVFAAASMKNALDDVDAAFTKKTGIKVLASYAASSALMKQIEQGAPCRRLRVGRLAMDGLWLAKETRKGRHAL